MPHLIALLLVATALPSTAAPSTGALSTGAPSIATGAEVPPVLLTAGHQKLCRVKVGDAMPGLVLRDAKQKEQPLKSQFGKRATVVALVGKKHWMNPALLADLPRDVVQPYGKQGVATVLVTVARTPAAGEKNDRYTLLSDPTGDAFAQLGNGKLPRVYVLDAEGKIVWFDIEYSRSTRRELKQTLAAMIGTGE